MIRSPYPRHYDALATHRCRGHRGPHRAGRPLHVLGAAAAVVMLLATRSVGDAQQLGDRYVVQPGDTLSAIARSTGLALEQLAAANQLADPDFIVAGQVLELTRVAQTLAGTYTVRAGDTLSGIAAANGVPLDALAAWNAIADPDVIAAGAVLRLLGGGDPPVILRPTIDWIGSPNYEPGWPSGPPIALVLHTMGGSLAGAEGQFVNAGSEVSAHFGIGVGGRVHQYVDLGDRAWANGILEDGHLWPGRPGVNPNDVTISIETEDLGSTLEPVSDAQYEATLAVARDVVGRHPTIRYLVTHRAIAPLTRRNDPGDRWLLTGRFTALANALKLIPVE